MSKRIYPDPDFRGFNGAFAGGKKVLPPNELNLAGIAGYMRSTGKNFSDLTPLELERYRLPSNSEKVKEA